MICHLISLSSYIGVNRKSLRVLTIVVVSGAAYFVWKRGPDNSGFTSGIL